MGVLSLGPMPDAVRALVRRLVAATRPERPDPDERLNGFLLTGGPAGYSYLDPDGQVERDWDYGPGRQRYVCWTVLEHRPSNTGVAYCDASFGPALPRGLVFLSGPHMNIGMDSAWFATLEGAVRESMAWDGPNPPGYEVA
jgi:hypothetical protein